MSGAEAALPLPLCFSSPYLFHSRCSIHVDSWGPHEHVKPHWVERICRQRKWRDWLRLSLGRWWPLGDGCESQESGGKGAARAGIPDFPLQLLGDRRGCSILFQVLRLLSSNVGHNFKAVEMDTVLVEFTLHHLKTVSLSLGPEWCVSPLYFFLLQR